MALEFGKRLGGIQSKMIRRDSSANFALDTTVGGFEITTAVTFMDYNKQTITYNFDVFATDANAAVTAVTGSLLPAFAIPMDLQGLQMLNYSVTVRQEIGFSDNPIPLYGNQREMFGVLEFPIAGDVVKVRFPTPTNVNLLPTDKRYLDIGNALNKGLPPFIALFTAGTLRIRGVIPGKPIQGYIRHQDSKTETKKTKIG